MISDSAAAKRVEILRRSAYRCPSLYRHRKRGKKRLDFTPFRSKMRFRVKSAGFLHEILRLYGIPWSATRHDRTDASVTHLRDWTTYREYYRDEFVDASVHICVAGPPYRRPPFATSDGHGALSMPYRCGQLRKILPLTFRKISFRVIFISLFCLHLSFMVLGFPAV